MTEYSAPLGAPVWFDLVSSDPARAAEFYGALFGWEAEEPNAEFAGYQNFTLGGRRVAGMHPHMAEAGGPSDIWSIYLRTDDAFATQAKLVENGGTEVFPPMPVGDLGTMAYGIDPAGAMIGYWQSAAHTGFAEWGVHGAPYWFECLSLHQPAATAFYEVVFGARPELVPGAPGNYTQLFYGDTAYAALMDATGMLPADVPSHWRVYITVDDVAATVAKAVELGGACAMEPETTPWGTLATITDPLGAMICLGHPPADM
ncbi:VOC family protein [Gordonia alkaliphila]|uniref:VOC family protein n=1 Tax=Gordonia alkaliphila TaxID=1053547 RepID=A0ABP8YT99_9ACTN